MKTIRNISIVLFLGFSIVVGLNLELFIEKTSDFIYVVSGQEERDLAEKREKEKIRKWNGIIYDIKDGLDNFDIHEENILMGMESFVTQEKLNELFTLKASSTNNDGDVIENICVNTLYKWRTSILVTNNSQVPVERVTIRFKAYNDDKNLTYENKSENYYFEYFLEPGDSEEVKCRYFEIRPEEYEELKTKKAIFKYEVIETSEHSQKDLPWISENSCDSYRELARINYHVFESSSNMQYLKENNPKLYERIPKGGFDIKQNLLEFCAKY